MKKRFVGIVLCVILCLSISFTSLADEIDEKSKTDNTSYSINIVMGPESPFFDISDFKEHGIARVGWGLSFGVALSGDDTEIKATDWNAVLPDGTSVEPLYMKEADTIAVFEAPKDMKGDMKIRAYIDGAVVSELAVTIVEPRKNLEEVSEEKTYVLPNGVTVRAWVLKEGYKYYIEPDETEQNELQKDNESQDVKDDSNAVTRGWFGMIGAMVKQMAK